MNIELQVQSGLTVPLTIESAARDSLERVVVELLGATCALAEERAGARDVLRKLGALVREEIAALDRRNVPLATRAAVEEFARALVERVTSEHQPPVSSDSILAQSLLAEIDWRFPSRYAATRVVSNLSQSDLSKLETTGRGVSAERMSAALGTLGVGVSLRPVRTTARVFAKRLSAVRSEAATGDKALNENARAQHFNRPIDKWAKGLTPQSPVQLLLLRLISGGKEEPSSHPAALGADPEPMVLLRKPHPKSPVRRLLVTRPWAWAAAGMQEKRLDEVASEIGKAIAAEQREPIEVVKAADRTVLQYSSEGIADDLLILGSILDLGTPLFENTRMHGWVQSPGIDPVVQRVEGYRFGSRLRALSKSLRDLASFIGDTGHLDLLTQFSELGSSLCERGVLPGPVARSVPVGPGVQTVLLLDYLVYGLVEERKRYNESLQTPEEGPMAVPIQLELLSVWTDRAGKKLRASSISRRLIGDWSLPSQVAITRLSLLALHTEWQDGESRIVRMTVFDPAIPNWHEHLWSCSIEYPAGENPHGRWEASRSEELAAELEEQLRLDRDAARRQRSA